MSEKPELVITPVLDKGKAVVGPTSQPIKLEKVEHTFHGPLSKEDLHLNLIFSLSVARKYHLVDPVTI